MLQVNLTEQDHDFNHVPDVTQSVLFIPPKNVSEPHTPDAPHTEPSTPKHDPHSQETSQLYLLPSQPNQPSEPSSPLQMEQSNRTILHQLQLSDNMQDVQNQDTKSFLPMVMSQPNDAQNHKNPPNTSNTNEIPELGESKENDKIPHAAETISQTVSPTTPQNEAKESPKTRDSTRTITIDTSFQDQVHPLRIDHNTSSTPPMQHTTMNHTHPQSGNHPDDKPHNNSVSIVCGSEKERRKLMSSSEKAQVEVEEKDGNVTSHRIVQIDSNSVAVAAKSKNKCPSLHVIAERVFVMRNYAIICLLLMIVNMFLLIYGLVTFLSNNLQPTVWYVSLDITSNMLLGLEVIIRIFAQTKTYWKNWANVFDFFVMLLSIFTLFLYLLQSTSIFFHSLILALRYFAQLFKVVVTLRTFRQQNNVVHAANELAVDFSTVDEREQTSASGSSPTNLHPPAFGLSQEQGKHIELTSYKSLKVLALQQTPQSYNAAIFLQQDFEIR